MSELRSPQRGVGARIIPSVSRLLLLSCLLTGACATTRADAVGKPAPSAESKSAPPSPSAHLEAGPIQEWDEDEGTYASIAPQPKATVKGALDKEVIREVVRGRLGDVRSCYDEALRKEPELSFRVVTQFVIRGDGRVEAAVVANPEELTGLAASTSGCIVGAVRGWKFPEPEGGGNVVVTYPFVLVPQPDLPPER